MQKSARKEDYFTALQDYFQPQYLNERKSVYWGLFAQTMEKFDQIMEIELKEIKGSLNDIFDKKGQYLKKLIEYKSSLRHQGQNKVEETLVVQNEKLHKFFQIELKEVSEIIKLFANDPELLSFLLRSYEDRKRFNFQDFSLNMANLFYTHYFLEEQCNSTSQFYTFVDAVFRDWNFDVDNVRMRHFSPHNDLIAAFFKHPAAECLVERMSTKFIAQLDIGESFCFDLATIQSQIQSKRPTQKSMILPEKVSFFDKIKRSFANSKTDEEIKYRKQSEQIISSQKQALGILKHRQDKFISVLRNTVEIILSEELPSICKLLLRAFHDKLNRQTKNKLGYSRHYCYLIFTMWIFSEFNIKFTMSHDQKDDTMTNVELQNVSEIIRALTMVFQAVQPLDKTIFYRYVIAEYKPRIQNFYARALQLGEFQQCSQMGAQLIAYEHSLKILSFNDIKIFCDLIKVAKKIGKELPISPAALAVEFTKETIYSTKSKVNFRKYDFEPENIYFMLKIQEEKILEQIGDCYLGRQFPLVGIPLLTESLLKTSNLPVEGGLELSRSIEFMKRLSAKQILKNLQKLQENFKTLKINESKVLNDQFMSAFTYRIKSNLLNKCQLSRRKNNICSQLNSTISIIDLYRTCYKSDTFYRNVTYRFVARLRVVVYVGIQAKKLKVSTEMPESEKKLHLTNFLMTQKPQEVMNSLLTHSYKQFDSLQKVMEAVAHTDVAKKAFLYGRGTQDFNEFFTALCDIAMGKVSEFLSQQKYLQHLNTAKFKSLLQQKLGQLLMKNMNIVGQIERDQIFRQRISQIDQQQFYDKQLGELNVQAFLFEQAVNEFNQIDLKPSAKQKINQFNNLVKFIFSVTSLTISREKITAEVITPIIQFVVLKAQPENCFKNLYIIQCLLGEYSHDTAYLITLWTSAVTYLNSLKAQPMMNSRMSVLSSTRESFSG